MGQGSSYPVSVLGGPDSALVAMTDTPELFGGEIHAIGVVDLHEGKIMRWVDYWDSATFDDALYGKMSTPGDRYPTDFGDIQAIVNPIMRSVCEALHQALIGSDDVAPLFAYDAVYEDMALRTSLVGRSAIARYIARLQGRAPFSGSARIRRIVGGASGGGYEWLTASGGVRTGVTALELDEKGLITRLTAVYDSRRLDAHLRSDLVLASAEC